LPRAQVGQVLLGILETEVRVPFAGYGVEQYKAAAVAVSAMFPGLAGALTAFHERIASPENFSWPLSGGAVLYATLGGTGTLLGTFLGAAVVVLAREVLSDLVRSWLLLVGATYIAFVFLVPGGIYQTHLDKGT